MQNSQSCSSILDAFLYLGKFPHFSSCTHKSSWWIQKIKYTYSNRAELPGRWGIFLVSFWFSSLQPPTPPVKLYLPLELSKIKMMGGKKVIQIQRCLILIPPTICLLWLIKQKFVLLLLKHCFSLASLVQRLVQRKAAGHVQSHSENSERKTLQAGQSSLVIQPHCCQWMDTDTAAFTDWWQVGLLWTNRSLGVMEGWWLSLRAIIDIHLNGGLLAGRSAPLPDGPAVAWAGHTTLCQLSVRLQENTLTQSSFYSNKWGCSSI